MMSRRRNGRSRCGAEMTAWGTALLVLASCVRITAASASPSDILPVTLEWRDVSCAIHKGKGPPPTAHPAAAASTSLPPVPETSKGKAAAGRAAKKVILDGIDGRATPGRMLAVMGPSGCGKSSLLNAVAGQMKQSKGLVLEGSLAVNGKAVASGHLGVPFAYVTQYDTFYSQMTVRETLLFAARLRLPRSVKLKENKRIVDELMEKLGLTKSADTIVGDQKIRGISGGERKRLNIACELISSPSVIFLDEPTSGLDSFQAERLVQQLRTLAGEGHTIVAVIHQPSASIFNAFDDLLLLSEGRMMYSGPRKRLNPFLKSVGQGCPAGHSLAEWALRQISMDTETPAQRVQSEERLQRLASASKALTGASVPPLSSGRGPNEGATLPASARPSASGLEQFRLLFARAWREVNRAKLALFIKAMQQIMTAVIYGSIYKLSDDQRSIQNRFGLLSLVTIGAANLGIATTIRAFPKEKTIVNNERAKNIYGVLPYFLSKLIAEAPVSSFLSALFGCLLYPMVGLQRRLSKFLTFIGVSMLQAFGSAGLGMAIGALAPNSDVALALFPPLVVLLVIFNGFNISEDSTPKYLRWLPKMSLVRWGFEALSVNEFTDLEFTCKDARGPCLKTGEEALGRVALERASVRGAVMAQARILAGSYIGTYAALRASRPSFAKMHPPTAKTMAYRPF